MGDSYIAENYPNDAREFNNLNAEGGYGYKNYTDKINDDQRPLVADVVLFGGKLTF